ncbi:unnamed protein product [Phytophthora fragariaefolia]|uniref:Unnamed protein product n=1 Tax=Phytophthora fragariaefolia TaxID=1490495 RepID=A0A9W6XVB7_9STRA|nr:unnamed protein product [Phytophthora fragariaefolia]
MNEKHVFTAFSGITYLSYFCLRVAGEATPAAVNTGGQSNGRRAGGPGAEAARAGEQTGVRERGLLPAFCYLCLDVWSNVVKSLLTFWQQHGAGHCGGGDGGGEMA